MPNWCANRLRVTGLAENVSKVRALMRGEVRPLWACAEGQGIQLFLAGCAGLLRPVTDDTYAPYPALTAVGQGEHTPENAAFTAWLMQLRDGVNLTEENCDRLHDLWLASGLSSRTWDSLDRDAQAVMAEIWRKKHSDWAGLSGPGLSECWNRICSDDDGEGAAQFDMRLLLPTRLDVEINGFNGGLLADVPEGYGFYLGRYGVKLPCDYAPEVTDDGPDFLEVDFDTPWSPPDGRVFAALSGLFGVAIGHWYAESGCDFCGYDAYADGLLTDSMSSALEWDEEDGYACVTGPEWIVNNVGHYGG
ncbi:DUF1281 domain-containing protein [Pantoea dispersa]|uniref:DUF1281 domain-containing protein n=1 Tax=Pantoea dispersa TaxID=59814 RepID=UPI001239B006|nr:DUF1281 domain-containing protein [Pantoea dispersa]KAA8669087.1 DUF1281 domain-containing protein [Pantoea dispersa]